MSHPARLIAISFSRAKFPTHRSVCLQLILLLSISNMHSAYAHPVSQTELTKKNFSAQGPIVESMKDGASFIEKMDKDIADLNDYSLLFETTTYKKDGSVVERGNLFFKKPKMMRIEEIGEYNKGSVAVIGRDGKARAKGSGLAGLITITTKPDDKILDAANGDKMEDSDFASLAKVLKDRLKSGQKSRVTEKPVLLEGLDEPAFVLEIFPADNPKKVLKRVYVHPTHNLPIRWDDYDYKDPCLSIWKNFKLNPGLSEELFKL